jgi:hypothetical protein
MKFKFLFFSVAFLFISSLSLVFSESVPIEKRFGFRIIKDSVMMYTKGNIYVVSPECINCQNNLLYFAAQDSNANKNMISKKTENIEVITDEENKKVLKATFLLGEDDKIFPDYKLELFLEMRREYPFLAIYSKFFYTGKDTHACGINWGLESYPEPLYKYYTIPQKGKLNTYRLVKTRRNKIGQANWIFANRGDGTGAGLIAPAVILGKGEDFIFVNSVPPKKKLTKDESLDVFMIFMPIQKNFTILGKIFEEIKQIEWKY